MLPSTDGQGCSFGLWETLFSLDSQLSQPHMGIENQEITTLKGTWPFERRNKIQIEKVMYKEVDLTEEIDKLKLISLG